MQCEAFNLPSGLRCVMEAGHQPLGADPSGVPLIHNFGGLGPFTPGMQDAAPPEEPRVQRWTYDGVVLDTNDMGEISLDELKEFVAHIERVDATEFKIRLHAFGLRATRLTGKSGPYIDWRD